MKIAMINFPILDVGGITTYGAEIKSGWEKLGHDVDYYHMTGGKRLDVSEEENTFIGVKYKRGERLPGKVLSYHISEIEDTISALDEYDILFFVHPSPHPTKSQLEYSNPLGWLDLYKRTKGKKITVFHDMFWRKTNAWYILASPYVDCIVAAQKPFWPSLEEYPHFTPIVKDWAYFPLTVADEPNAGDREQVMIVPPQWIKWKNHHKLIEAVKEETINWELYAGGQEYHNLHKEGKLQEFLTENAVEEEVYREDAEFHRTYRGFVTRDELVSRYHKCLFSIDPSTRGYNNYTHFEPMMYGCISFVHEKVLAKENNTIPEDCCVSYNWSNIDKKIRWALKNPDKVAEIRQRAYEFISENFDSVKIAQQFLENLDGAKASEEVQAEEDYVIELFDISYDYIESGKCPDEFLAYCEPFIERIENASQEIKDKFQTWVEYFVEAAKVLSGEIMPETEEVTEEAQQTEETETEAPIDTCSTTGSVQEAIDIPFAQLRDSGAKEIEIVCKGEVTIRFKL